MREHLIAQVGGKTSGRHHVDLALEQILQILLDGDEIQQRSTALELHQQVEVALGRGRPPHTRTENADRHSTVSMCDPQNLGNWKSGKPRVHWAIW